MYSSLMCWHVLSLLSIYQRWYSAMDSILFVWKRGTSCSLKRCLCHRNTSSMPCHPHASPNNELAKRVSEERDRGTDAASRMYTPRLMMGVFQVCNINAQFRCTTPVISIVLWPYVLIITVRYSESINQVNIFKVQFTIRQKLSVSSVFRLF